MSHQHQQHHQQQQLQDHHLSHGSMLLPTSGIGGGMRTEQHGNQILHVRGDSDSDLEALFSVLHNIDGRQTSSSFKNRKLPASFFRPPDPKAGAAGVVIGGQTGHGRSVSSPAQLHHGNGNGNVGSSHGKSTAGSAGVAGADNFLDEQTAGGGVPSSWEASKNCPRYYLTPGVGLWQQDLQGQHGPMSGHSPAVYQGRGGGSGGGTPTAGGGIQSHQHGPATSPSADYLHQDPLPHGWEQGITPDGEIYFINHVDKTTSWYDPRIPRHRQTATPARVGSHPMIAHSHQQHQQQPQQTQQHNHLSPKQQQQTQCHMHVPHQQMMSNAQHVGGGGVTGGSGTRSAHSEHFICLELQKLHKEKERLQQEQEAISCREMILNELVRQSSATSPCGGISEAQMKCNGGGGAVISQQPEGALAMIQTMQSLYGSSMNPESFASSSCGGAGVESHARQNSTDSGLGGMGTTYSLPRSPEDYLSNVDEIDMQEDASPVQKLSNPCYMQMTSGSDLVHMHLSSVTDMMEGASSVMDGEQLFSSLAGDVNADLLSEMDVQKIDSILYL